MGDGLVACCTDKHAYFPTPLFFLIWSVLFFSFQRASDGSSSHRHLNDMTLFWSMFFSFFLLTPHHRPLARNLSFPKLNWTDWRDKIKRSPRLDQVRHACKQTYRTGGHTHARQGSGRSRSHRERRRLSVLDAYTRTPHCGFVFSK